MAIQQDLQFFSGEKWSIVGTVATDPASYTAAAEPRDITGAHITFTMTPMTQSNESVHNPGPTLTKTSDDATEIAIADQEEFPGQYTVFVSSADTTTLRAKLYQYRTMIRTSDGDVAVHLHGKIAIVPFI